MKYVWPKKTKLQVFLDAKARGELTLELKTQYEAELFRFALYNFRRRYKIGEEFLSFQILVNDNKLTIFNNPPSEIKLLTGT